MSAFSADWLALREGADARARDAWLVDGLADTLAVGRPAGQTLRVVDLGSGSGANLRWLAPRLGHDQDWLLLDHDSVLLGHAPRAVRAWARAQGHAIAASGDALHIAARDFSAQLHWRRLDLATQLDELALDDVDLVTAAALLDLVSHTWIDGLVERCRADRCAALFVLSYDGRVAWQPGLAEDAVVTALLNRHQRRDKGFGPAAGPHAAAYTGERLQAAGFRVTQCRSDWQLGDADASLQQALARGWAQAAAEAEPARQALIAAWLARRLGQITRHDSALSVGHVDLLGLPPAG